MRRIRGDRQTAGQVAPDYFEDHEDHAQDAGDDELPLGVFVRAIELRTVAVLVYCEHDFETLGFSIVCVQSGVKTL